jgi:hypothetical protein
MSVGDRVLVKGAPHRNGWVGIVAVDESDDDLKLIEFDAGKFWHRKHELVHVPIRHDALRDVETR